MNRPVLLPALALATLVTGCVVKPSATVEVYQACTPPTPSSTGGCTYPTGACTTVPLGTYQVDVSATPDFFLGVEVHNQLSANSSDIGGNNTHTAYIDSYSVSYSGVDAPDTRGDIQNTVPAAGSAVVGVLLADADALDAMATHIPASGVLHITASLKLKGKWGDQSRFETAPRSFGVDVCNGCYVPPTCAAGKTLYVCPGPGIWPSSFSCGGSGGGTTYTLGGTVTGLTNGTLVVSCTGLSNVTVPANSGSTQGFTFAGGLTDGTSYTCTIDGTSTTTQSCVFDGGSEAGTVNGANVTSISLTCT